MPPKPDDPQDEPPNSPPPPTSPTSPPSRPRGSRHASTASTSSVGRRDHAPLTPSSLRRSIVQSESPESTVGPRNRNVKGKGPSMVEGGNSEGIEPTAAEGADTEINYSDQLAERPEWAGHEHNPRTRLLGDEHWDAASGCGSENCGHGTFSPRPLSPRQDSYSSYGSFDYSSSLSQRELGGPYPGSIGADGENSDPTNALLGDAISDGVLGGGHGNKMSTTKWLAKKHGVRSRRLM
jgi:hypothetical protein